jgi:hypothetical protein
MCIIIIIIIGGGVVIVMNQDKPQQVSGRRLDDRW